MAKKHTYQVEYNGSVMTRTTARTYTHVVVVKGRSDGAFSDKYYDLHWCGRPDLADKALTKALTYWADARILPVPQV